MTSRGSRAASFPRTQRTGRTVLSATSANDMTTMTVEGSGSPVARKARMIGMRKVASEP